MALTQIPLSTLAGTSETAVSETNKLIDDVDSRIPTSDEKSALGGTSGTPSASNPYATKATTDSTASALTSHTADTDNPHSVTSTQVGLGNCDNTADEDKPVSTAQATAIALKAPLASPALTGTPTAPTPATGSNATLVATTAFLQSELDDLIPFSPILSNTGDGTGVATLTVTLSDPTTARLDGRGYFYTDAGGTTGETQKTRLATGSNTLYIKVKKSSSVLTFLQGQRVTQINSWASTTNAPSITLSIADMPSGFTLASIGSSNTVSGSIADVPSGVTLFSVTGGNTISGSFADVPSGATYIVVTGSNTCVYNTTDGLHTWPSNMRMVYCRSSLATSLTSAMIDALLIDLAATTWTGDKTISLKGTRTSASDAAIATLEALGVMVSIST